MYVVGLDIVDVTGESEGGLRGPSGGRSRGGGTRDGEPAETIIGALVELESKLVPMEAWERLGGQMVHPWWVVPEDAILDICGG